MLAAATDIWNTERAWAINHRIEQQRKVVGGKKESGKNVAKHANCTSLALTNNVRPLVPVCMYVGEWALSYGDSTRKKARQPLSMPQAHSHCSNGQWAGARTDKRLEG